MIEREVTIVNRLGLHARAAAKLVSVANKFSSQVEISVGAKKVNAKSIMGVMMLAAGLGSTITLHIKGEDSKATESAIVELIENKFGEES